MGVVKEDEKLPTFSFLYFGETNNFLYQTMDSFGVSLAITALKALAFMYDVITYPVYFVIQRPWKQRMLSKRIKAVPIAFERRNKIKDEMTVTMNKNCEDAFGVRPFNKAIPITTDVKSITYRAVDSPLEIHVEIVQNKLDTMEKMFKYIVKKYASRKCLGTRQILNEEDEVQPNGRIFKKYNMGDYKWKTFAEIEELATQFGHGLRSLGCQAKKNVAIFAETRAEWMIAAQALFKENIPICTIYATLGDDGISHALNETEVDTVITSHDLLPKIKGILPKLSKLKTIIYMEDQLKEPKLDGFNSDQRIIKFQEVIKLGKNAKIVSEPPKAGDLAIIMYTSGSTGTPKGVMITHTNLIATLKGFCDKVVIKPNDVLIGFLPLAHVFELLAEHVCLSTGIPIGYSTPLTLFDTASKIKKGTKGDASVLQPTCMTAVPLILDRVSKGIQEKVSKGSTLSKILFKFAYDYKLYWISRGHETPILDKLIFSKVKSLLGGKVRLVLIGGAPLSPDTHEQIKVCLCKKVIQGYGLTETTSMATVMDFYDMTYGRVGAPTTMSDIKIIDWDEGNYRVSDKPYPRGELVIGGENITLGYFKNPEKTKEDYFEENGKRWFKTGDIGEFHKDGVIKIIDRKKDLVKLQAGEYVSLGKVEAELKTCGLVENICVYGDPSKQFTVALIVPNPKSLEDIAAKLGITNLDFEHLCNDRAIEKAVLQELADHGKKCKLEKFEIPAAIKLCTEVWSPDMGLVTAAFKLKRKDIQERYQHEINRMYAS